MSRPRAARPSAGDRARATVRGLAALDARRKRTVAAAALLLVTFVSPWFTSTTIGRAATADGLTERSGSISAVGCFSGTEAAVLVVLAALGLLTWGRASRRSFSLPFRDGTVVAAAGVWCGLLLVTRLFDIPSGPTGAGTTSVVHLSWGIFASLAACGLLVATGLDQRRSGAPDTTAPADAPHAATAVVPRPTPGASWSHAAGGGPAEAVTAVAPAADGDPAAARVPVPPSRPQPTPLGSAPAAGARRPTPPDARGGDAAPSPAEAPAEAPTAPVPAATAPTAPAPPAARPRRGRTPVRTPPRQAAEAPTVGRPIAPRAPRAGGEAPTVVGRPLPPRTTPPPATEGPDGAQAAPDAPPGQDPED